MYALTDYASIDDTHASFRDNYICWCFISRDALTVNLMPLTSLKYFHSGYLSWQTYIFVFIIIR